MDHGSNPSLAAVRAHSAADSSITTEEQKYTPPMKKIKKSLSYNPPFGLFFGFFYPNGLVKNPLILFALRSKQTPRDNQHHSEHAISHLGADAPGRFSTL